MHSISHHTTSPSPPGPLARIAPLAPCQAHDANRFSRIERLGKHVVTPAFEDFRPDLVAHRAGKYD